MSSLSLLNDYISDEDSVQEEAEDGGDSSVHERLPLPNSLKIIPIEEEVRDEPEKHDGRIRSYAHQRGNWNSLIFVPYQRSTAHDILCDQITELCKPTADLKRIDEPHISLTRTFILLYHWIDNFVSTVKKSFLSFARFDVQFDGLNVYCNEEKTRTFLALTVGFGKMELTKSVQLIDKCLSEYNLHPFYEEASFHMSILWCLGDKKQDLAAVLPELNEVLEANLNESLDITIPITRYVCKIGNRLYHLQLL